MKCKICGPLIGTKNSYEISFLDSDLLDAHAWLYPFDQARKMISISKYHGEFCHYRHQARRLACVIQDIESQSGLTFKICYVPTISNHVKRRGFDHSKVLAKKTSFFAKRNIESGLRALHSSSQVGKSKFERMTNPSFECKSPILCKNIILIDDVATTRSTLFHASEALKEAGVRNVFGLTLSFNSSGKIS